MKTGIYLLALTFIFIADLSGQNNEFNLQNYHPASPGSFQFMNYSEMPVSEYSGIPSVSIPLYQIDVDGLKIPLNISYHSGGFRVKQEASWVGLGWDLQVGSIVQEINDRDDYGVGIIPLKPDWNEAPYPEFYDQKYSDLAYGILNPGWNDVVPVLDPKPVYSYRIYSSYPIATGAHSYYAPLNGHRDQQPDVTNMIDYLNYDSEPDIFSANFLGHSIKFIKGAGVQIIVLNNAGYKVQKTGSSFRISVPTGEDYYFDLMSQIDEQSVSGGGIIGTQPLTPTLMLPSSKVWVLKKIMTINKKEILFNYNSFGIVGNYPNYSEKYDKILTSSGSQISGLSGLNVSGGGPTFAVSGDGIARTYSFTQENRFWLNSIVFPNGNIIFSASGRDDLPGGPKLNRISINSETQEINRYDFNYSYFDASSIAGNHYDDPNISGLEIAQGAMNANTSNLRLKLLSITDSHAGQYNFSYDATPLPAKNSFAQDYWGFYNGKLSNSSCVPNPSRLSVEEAGVQLSTLIAQNNGNNNSAQLEYTKACVLTSIQYPTGGKVNFEYELNQFDNYLLPDYNTTTNQITSGNGVRLHAVNYQANDAVSKRTVYNYQGGKASLPLQIGRTFDVNTIQTEYSSYYHVWEINDHCFYSTNALGSGNYVGYDKVIKSEEDQSGVAIGKTETLYNNIPDRITSSAGPTSQVNAALPATKPISVGVAASYSDFPESGTVKSVSYYDNQNNLLKKIENNYSTLLSDIFYGVRLFGDAPEGFIAGYNSQGGPYYWVFVPRTLAGYYPIYDIKSLLESTKTTEYDNTSGGSISNTIVYGYDPFNQLSYKQTRSSKDEYIEENFDHAYNYFQQTGSYLLMSAHRLSEATGYHRIKRKSNYWQSTPMADYTKEYQALGDKVIITKMKTNDHPGTGEIPTITTYNNYDMTNGNLLDYTSKGITYSLIWDYNGEYVTAEASSAGCKEIAATSFESNGKGNFSYMAQPVVDATAPTGKKVFNLSNGAITTSFVNSTKKYTVNFWLKNGSGTCLVNGNTGTLITEKNGWQLYEVSLDLNTSSVNITGTGTIDELREYPVNANIITYTYDLLVGITSQCDINNKIIYYEYDGAKRLKLIRDVDKNILKKICYNYAGQPEECQSTVSAEPWWTATGETRCQPCPENNNYSNGIRERKEKDLNPNSGSVGNTRWVSEGPGTCASPPDWQTQSGYCEEVTGPGGEVSFPITYTGNLIATQTDVNPCSPTHDQIRQITIPNSTQCVTSGCSSTSCVGPQYKCILGVCEAGVWSVVKIKKPYKGAENWVCMYAYCFSDHTISSYTLTITSPNPCDMTCY